MDRILWILPLLTVLTLNATFGQTVRFPFPDPGQIHLMASDAVESGTFLSLGMRRLAADIAFIELLVYYGTETGADDERQVPTASGHYPEIAARTRQILDLDPFFSYAPLYGSGALAFNLNRPQEALEILRVASQRDPGEWQYRTYMAAIGAHQKGDPEAVIKELSPALSDPQCPTLIKHILAFLNRRLGHRDEAIRLYLEVIRSRDQNYAQIARDALRQMGVPQSQL